MKNNIENMRKTDRMNKRGDANTMKIVIVSLIVAVLLLIVAKTYSNWFSEKAKDMTCEATILKANLAKDIVGDIALLTRLGTLKCNDLPDIEIKKSNVMKGSKVNNDAFNKLIADRMLRCWKMFGKGYLDPFKKYEDDQSYCMICSDVIFDDAFVEKAKEDKTFQPKGLLRWMAAHTVPDLKISYYKALFGADPVSSELDAFEKEEQLLNINEQYILVWRLDAKKKSFAAEFTARAAGLIAGAFLGSKIKMTFTGAAAGYIGASWLLDKIVPDSILSTGIYFVPKRFLGEDVKFQAQGIYADKPGDKPKDIETPFCTKLVNY